MFYYKKNIGAYMKKAGRLSLLQHGVYNQLIDACYDREQFPTFDEAVDWIWASSDEEIEALTFVLSKFFELKDGVYVQSRIAEELAEYYELCAKNAKNGKRGGRPKNKPGKTHSVIKETQSVNLKSESEPDGNPSETASYNNYNYNDNDKNNEKNNTSENKFSDDDHALANFMFAEISKPDVAPKSKKPDFDKWADVIRLMRERDGHTLEEITEIFKWANAHHFWKTNILSPQKLREQFAKLDSQRRNENATSNQPARHVSAVDSAREELDRLGRERAEALQGRGDAENQSRDSVGSDD